MYLNACGLRYSIRNLESQSYINNNTSGICVYLTPSNQLPMVCEPSTDHPLFAFVLHFSGNITARWHQSERLSTAISVIIRTGSDHFNPVLDHPQSNWWPEESAMLKELFRLRRILFVSKINVYECFVRHWSRNNMQRYCPSQSPRPGASKHANRPLPPLYVEYNIAVFSLLAPHTRQKLANSFASPFSSPTFPENPGRKQHETSFLRRMLLW